MRFMSSHPLWMRGLKFIFVQREYSTAFVASFMDAWIEIEHSSNQIIEMLVASFMDAWIEMKHIGS